jgi:hypothetical protein
LAIQIYYFYILGPAVCGDRQARALADVFQLRPRAKRRTVRQQFVELTGRERIPSGPSTRTSQPSSARARALAMATTTLNRIVVVVSCAFEAYTMKVTAITFWQYAMSSRSNFRSSLCKVKLAPALPSSLRFDAQPGSVVQDCDFEPASTHKPLRKSSRACFPASSAAR